jgi:hypothetical protein
MVTALGPLPYRANASSPTCLHALGDPAHAGGSMRNVLRSPGFGALVDRVFPSGCTYRQIGMRPQEHWRREDMMRRTRDLRMVICLILAALAVGCAGDRMSRSTEEAVDDNLLANKVKMALYADKQVRGRQMTVEASQGVIQLSGVAASTTEAQRAVQIAQGIKGVKEVRNRLTVQ